MAASPLQRSSRPGRSGCFSMVPFRSTGEFARVKHPTPRVRRTEDSPDLSGADARHDGLHVHGPRSISVTKRFCGHGSRIPVAIQSHAAGAFG